MAQTMGPWIGGNKKRKPVNCGYLLCILFLRFESFSVVSKNIDVLPMQAHYYTAATAARLPRIPSATCNAVYTSVTGTVGLYKCIFKMGHCCHLVCQPLFSAIFRSVVCLRHTFFSALSYFIITVLPCPPIEFRSHTLQRLYAAHDER